MCGIVGYAGKRQAAPILLDGLKRLEYRGYDSAGICVHGPGGMNVQKSKGRLSVLEGMTDSGRNLPGMIGIGHTRWATHGVPSDRNSHPHVSASGKIAVVHNGIIENEACLRHKMEKQGVPFQSDTDTEVIANLIGDAYDSCHDLKEAVFRAVRDLNGSFALAILCADMPDTLIAVKQDSPLVVGFGQGEYYVASDVSAILQFTREIADLNDGEMVMFTGECVQFHDKAGKIIEKTVKTVDWQQEDAQLGGYDHFMIKEIFEQPKAVGNAIDPRIQGGKVSFENLNLAKEYLKRLRKISLVGCGSAYYVCLTAKYEIEKTCRIPTEAVLASEFRYCDPVLDASTLFIAISQSGETADTLAALREAKRRNAKTVAIVNAIGSAMAKEADHAICTNAGPEIAVATTKAFSAQLAVTHLLGLYMAEKLGSITPDGYARVLSSIQQLPQQIGNYLHSEHVSSISNLANRYWNRHNAFYIGRNTDSAVCLEGSLKLKEIAYLHSEAYPAGELKHGPISMIEQGTLVVAMATVDALFDKTMANIREVKARGADVLCVTLEARVEEAREIADHVITVPAVHPAVQPSLSLLPLQLFAYYVAVRRGCDVDKPRNLAKSVTVE